MATSKPDPVQLKAVIKARERLMADPTSLHMIRYSDLALPFMMGLHIKDFHIMPRREGANTVAVVEGADQALAYLRSWL